MSTYIRCINKRHYLTEEAIKMDIGKKLGEILVEQNVLSELQLKEVMRAKKFFPDKKMGEIIEIREFATEEQIYRALANQHHFKYADLNAITSQPAALEIMPIDKAMEFDVMPLAFSDGTLTIASSDAGDLNLTDNISFYLNGIPTQYVIATPTAISRAQQRALRGGAEDFDTNDQIHGTLQDIQNLALRESEDIGDDNDENSAPVIKYVDSMINKAVEIGASDIHIEPFEKLLRVRYRIDGVLQEIEGPSKQLQGPIIARCKIMSGMNISERRKPQDGRIKAKVDNGKKVDLRVSALPAFRGESIVMRILDPENANIRLDQLGFSDTVLKKFLPILTRPNGIMMLCGPTGSGKTTTLYAALQHLNKPNVKIITAEEPVEYNIHGINQCNVNRAVGLSFERIVRAMLRQAPNIILIGEIRDLETANIAVRASLTGHLVFSTIHTNDAPSAVTRLVDIGLEKFLVASSLYAVLGQRLVRTNCVKCKAPVKPPFEVIHNLSYRKEVLDQANWMAGKGCKVCHNNGMKGRMGIHELMMMTPSLRKLTFEGASTVKLRQQAINDGMISLFDDGISKALNGLTTIEEILTYARVME